MKIKGLARMMRFKKILPNASPLLDMGFALWENARVAAARTFYRRSLLISLQQSRPTGRAKPFTHTRLILSLLTFVAMLAGSIDPAAVGADGVRPGWRHPTAASAQEGAPSPHTLHLPIIFNKFPLRTVFAVETIYTNEIPFIADIPATWMRYNGAIWADVEPNEGDRKWKALAVMETNLRLAQQNHVSPLVIVRQTPAWAQLYQDAGCGPIKPEKLEAFGRFMFDLVKRYSAPPYNVLYWEIWNEPDVSVDLAYQQGGENTPFGCWGNYSDPYFGGEYYAEMLKAVYPQVKAANPRAQVIIGGLLLGCNPDTNCPTEIAPRFFEGILRNQGADYFDYVGFHNYDDYLGAASSEIGPYGTGSWNSYWDTNGPSIVAKVNFLRKTMAAYGVDKPIMNTETALLCGGFDDTYGGPGCESTPTSPFEITKAAYIVHSYVNAISIDLKMNVWFFIKGWRNSGLIFRDNTPRPAYLSMAFARSELADAAFTGNMTPEELNNHTALAGYKFKRDGLNARRIWVIWALGRGTYTLTLPARPLAILDMYGASILDPLTPKTVDITLRPVYIEWGP